jgi:hypothetical protein
MRQAPFAASTAFGFVSSTTSSIPLAIVQLLRWRKQAQQRWLKEAAFSFGTLLLIVVRDERARGCEVPIFAVSISTRGNTSNPGTFGNWLGWFDTEYEVVEPKGVQS